MIKAHNRLPDQQVVLTGTRKKLRIMWDYREMYIFMILGLVSTAIFTYIPMYGVIMAFQDARMGTIIGQAEWIGLYQFENFMTGMWFPIIVPNTIKFALIGKLIGIPCNVGLALLLHNSTRPGLKKFTQNMTYLPNMLSVVVILAIVNLFINEHNGLIDAVLRRLGHVGIEESLYLDADWTMFLYFFTGVWSGTGYGAIIYIGALSAVDGEIEEAARIDGASKLRLIWHIQLPTILPTLITTQIMSLASVLSGGGEKLLLMQNNITVRETEMISSYVYKNTITHARYGFSTAVSLWQNLIELILMLIFNWLGDKLAGISVV